MSELVAPLFVPGDQSIAFSTDQFILFNRLAQIGPVVAFEAGGSLVNLVSGAQALLDLSEADRAGDLLRHDIWILMRQILTEDSNNTMMVSLDNNAARQIRQAANPALTPKHIASIIGHAAANAHTAITALAAHAGTPVDILPMMRHIVQDITLELLFGRYLDATGSSRVVDAVNCIVATAAMGLNEIAQGRQLDDAIMQESLQAGRILREYVAQFIRDMERIPEAEQPLTLISALARHFTPKQVAEESIGFWLASVATTSDAMSYILWMLAQNPDVQARGRAEVDQMSGSEALTAEHLREMTYIGWIVDEGLRLYPSFPYAWRRAAVDITLDNYPVEKGSAIIAYVHPAHYNPAYWDQPEKCMPERFAQPPVKGSYMPFWFGPRSCAGMYFALENMKMLVALMLQQFTIEPVTHEPLHMVLQMTLRPIDGKCPIILHPRG